jgi:hypothetical protein
LPRRPFCDCGAGPQEQLKQQPVLICEKDGVKLWKVADKTRGGSDYVYFTTPAGDVRWEEKGGEGSEPRGTTSGVRRAERADHP